METGASAHINVVADIVAAYVSNNSVPLQDLATVIASVSASLNGLGQSVEEPTPDLVPAVPAKKSVHPDYIVCLDDGKKFKSLRRHLSTLGMTAEEYRTKWGLPRDYPMVCPNYAAQRSELAKASGLGNLRNVNAPKHVSLVPKAPGKRGRPRKEAA